MYGCLLCLEINNDFEDCIKVNSTQWQKLNIENLLEKYLWAIIKMETLKSYTCLCSTCWKELYEFHKFYKRIEQAHMDIESVMKCEIGIELLHEENHNIDTGPRSEKGKCVFESNGTIESEILIIKEEIPLDEIIKEDEKDDDDDTSLQKRRKCVTKNETKVIKKLNRDPLKKTKKTKHIRCKAKREKESFIKTIAPTTASNTKDEKEFNIKIHTNTLKTSKEIFHIPETLNDQDVNNHESDSNDSDNNPLVSKDSSNENNSYHNPYYTPRTNPHKLDELISDYFPISCSLCKISIDNFSIMIKHFKKEHKQRGYVKCCKRKFFGRSDLIDHINVHTNPELFKCKECNKILANRSCLRLHIKKVHEGVEKKAHCNICDKYLADKHSLQIHKYTMHEVKDEDRVTCSQCDRSFRNKVSLNNHIITAHLKKYIKICDFCGETIADKDRFRRHMLQHEGKPVPTISCSLCGRRYTDRKSLRRHMNLQHSEKTEFNCHMCTKKFASRDNVNKHIKTVHELSYVNKCTICEKSFRRPDALRDHMARHNGTPLHSCPWCPKAFYSNGQMHAHRKEVHPKEWEEDQREKFSGNLPPKYKPPAAITEITHFL